MKTTAPAHPATPTAPLPLYHHKTDGGAEYLTDKFILCPNGHKEGIFEGANFVVRLDGDITKDAHLRIKGSHAANVARIKELEKALTLLANRAETQAERLNSKAMPGHPDYVSKIGAAANLLREVSDARAAMTAAQPDQSR